MNQMPAVTKTNLTLCGYNYFYTCWCSSVNSNLSSCTFLLRHVASNSSHICVWHIIRQLVECFDISVLQPSAAIIQSSTLSDHHNQAYFSSSLYIYCTIILFVIGLFGNGLSVLILLSKSLRKLSVYRNLAIICGLNIAYLTSIFVRHNNFYKHDIRKLSVRKCHLHSFLVAYLGHLCSWQLCSMSIERVHALLSLQAHRPTSWIRTTILFLIIAIPLFLFDGQLLFKYGLNSKINSICLSSSIRNDKNISINNSQDVSHHFQRAFQYPINLSSTIANSTYLYHTTSTQNVSFSNMQHHRGGCVLWNIYDGFIYALIPFIITTICSFIVVLKVCERRRLTVVAGGGRHMRQTHARFRISDNLSVVLIAVNILFLLMTSPFNFYLIINSFQPNAKCFQHPLLNEILRTIQNAYHALNFVFYCVVGKKFRNSFLHIYLKIYKRLLCRYTLPFTILTRCCDERRRSSSGVQITNLTNSDPKYRHVRLIRELQRTSIEHVQTVHIQMQTLK
ncbi:unnamed protein product [Didymodactylos carnosus]|uniref:G-protein coupled receptors family 1 profile domain-containing protein n=1 Tax=Didymodactylos carnosus TaxID=1234261 RepID=A0A813RKR9_9BILA|nr:unnamed protein product [Didymodactylos carnosus]CAF0793806.1 unnamed protein product [Didymodactylos carnosus]CAF3569316.1 unnamed protein product [Didymodactylos carnosus]CAF3576653.1 unnamed protein product [Didymodactylos carnosus]